MLSQSFGTAVLPAPTIFLLKATPRAEKILFALLVSERTRIGESFKDLKIKYSPQRDLTNDHESPQPFSSNPFRPLDSRKHTTDRGFRHLVAESHNDSGALQMKIFTHCEQARRAYTECRSLGVKE